MSATGFPATIQCPAHTTVPNKYLNAVAAAGHEQAVYGMALANPILCRESNVVSVLHMLQNINSP